MWGYTPRQISGFIEFAAKRWKREQIERLSTGAMASRGDPKDIKRRIREAEKDG